MGENSQTSVFLGYANSLPPDQLYSLKRQYLPLGKIGGLPSWLDPVNLPSPTDLICSVCTNPLSFLMQVYCTDTADPGNAFHRAIFVFVCRNAVCCKPNDASNFRILRCQLPRINDFYSSEAPLNPWVAGDVPDPYHNLSTYAVLCGLCGCKATKKCSRCTSQWYCSRAHQIADWNSTHKYVCGKSPISDLAQQEDKEQKECGPNLYIFREYAIEMDLETNLSLDLIEKLHIRREEADPREESSDDEMELVGKQDQKQLSDKIKQLKEYPGLECDITNKDFEAITESVKDLTFLRFQQLNACNPEQILRYKRNGVPLLATDHSSIPEKIPNCLCGAARHFEFQLMPHLVSLLDVDSLGESLDWATVLVYSCSKSCQLANDGYAMEFVYKQDFVVVGCADEVKHDGVEK
uniref:MYND-type domain-containing protein n=1 Tax=Ditylenchus dipsaci TaxID=166011 RepID=A0A915D3T6_9BILA